MNKIHKKIIFRSVVATSIFFLICIIFLIDYYEAKSCISYIQTYTYIYKSYITIFQMKISCLLT